MPINIVTKNPRFDIQDVNLYNFNFLLKDEIIDLQQK